MDETSHPSDADPLAAAKDALRRRMRAVRAGLDAQTLDAAADAVARTVMAMPELASPTTVAAYLSVRRELPTGPLLRALVDRGHTVVVPAVEHGDLVMRQWTPDAPLVPGVLGIPVSLGPACNDVAVAICPGLAFDRSGRRLGYGGGYYDRWLARSPVLPIGVCVDDALIDEVPAGPHDHRMAIVVTPGLTGGLTVHRVTSADGA